MIYTQDDATIIAQSTPTGPGAIAMLRLSGANAIDIADSMCKLPSNKKLVDLPTHTIHYGFVVDPSHKKIDHAMFSLMRAPRTFTGQDVVEISCHNNQFIVQAIIARAIELGARMAHEGEFSKRAVLNSKMDLVQAEAINDLINANTQLALKKALAQLDGSFSAWLVRIEADLFKALAYSESSFEFIDEEMQFGHVVQEIVQHVLSKIAEIKKTFDVQQQIRGGVRIALIGSVNAGKSSLFNALLNKERAIVTNIAGTTRDAIEAGLYKNGNYWTLIDTAGLRQTDDVIEAQGIEKSFAEAKMADVILYTLDVSRVLSAEELRLFSQLVELYSHKIILVEHKSDLLRTTQKHPLNFSGEKIAVSSATKQNIIELEHLIQQRISALFAAAESPFLLNQRQFNVMLNLEKKLHAVLPMLNDVIAYELVSVHLKEALECISELTGKSVTELGMDKVFREFCVGK